MSTAPKPTTTKPSGAATWVPGTRSLRVLAQAAKGCQGCALHETATGTVFGEGPRDAPLMLVGEQPGDVEDRKGAPFVGPAGHVLDAALKAVGIARDGVYLTNAVKHFKWTPRGKRRMHARPRTSEIHACRPWLDAELAAVSANVVVCLGAVAAEALFGAGFRVTEHWDEVLEHEGRRVVVTYHPSAILRMPTEEARAAARTRLERDLSRAWKLAVEPRVKSAAKPRTARRPSPAAHPHA